MNLGVVEDLLLAALYEALGPDVELRAGPACGGPATGLRAQVFVHTAYIDAGGRTADGACVARQPLRLPRGVQGFVEQRPGWLDVDVHCLCAQHAQARHLAGLAAPVLLQALETMAPPLFSPPSDTLRRLRLADTRAHVHALRSLRLVHEGVAAAQVVLSLRVEGFLHVQLAAAGGLLPTSPYALPLQLHIEADPAGTDLAREHVQLRNTGKATVDLAGWTLHDAARRPHVYRFGAGQRLPAGATLRLWTGRGSDDATNLYWGRRAAVWNNTGDVAVLRDPEGDERARAQWSPPLPAVPAASPVPPTATATSTRSTSATPRSRPAKGPAAPRRRAG